MMSSCRAAGRGDPRVPGDLRPHLAANALMGLHRALLDYVRRRVLADDDPTGLAAEVRQLAGEAFELLSGGLRDYAARQRLTRPDGYSFTP